MTEPHDIRRILLPNSLELVCRDDSRRYFGDYHLVRVLLSLPVPLERRFFSDDDQCRSARSVLADPVVYRRSAEKMGVPSAEVAAVRIRLVEELLRHAGEYLGSERFPARFIQAELTKVRSGRGRSHPVPVVRGA